MKLKNIILLSKYIFLPLLTLTGTKKNFLGTISPLTTDAQSVLLGKIAEKMPPRQQREMKILNKTFLPSLQGTNKENVEDALKNYFLYPHLCGVLDTMNKEINESIIKREKSLFGYLINNNNWDQSKTCKDGLEALFQNNEYKSICYKNILRHASIPYFNSDRWKNFFQLTTQNSIIQFETQEVRNDPTINVSYDIINLGKITFGENQAKYKESSNVDMIYFLNTDFTRSKPFKLLIQKVTDEISQEKNYQKIRLVLTSKKQFNKQNLDEILSILNDSIHKNKTAQEKIRYLDLTYLLQQMAQTPDFTAPTCLQIIQKAENTIPNCITYMPKTLYLRDILTLSQQETGNVIPYPDYVTKIKPLETLNHITPVQLKIFLQNNCALDILLYLTLQMNEENSKVSEILNKYALLFSEHISPFTQTLNNYSVLSALIGACAKIYGKNPEDEHISTDIIKKIMKDYEIQNFQEMCMGELIDNQPTRNAYVNLMYFLTNEGILVPYTAEK